MEYPTPQMSDKARGATPRSGGGGELSMGKG